MYASASAKQVSQLVGFLVHVSCAVRSGKFFARRLVISVGASRNAAVADGLWVLVFRVPSTRSRGMACTVAFCASASAKQVSHFIGCFLHVSCVVHLGKLSQAPYSGLLGCVAYHRRSGLRRCSYLRVRPPQGMAACCCCVCLASAKQA